MYHRSRLVYYVVNLLRGLVDWSGTRSISSRVDIVFRLGCLFLRIGVLANDVNGMYHPWEEAKDEEEEVDE